MSSWAVPVARGRRLLTLLGPAFVAAVAYVDPGNVAANVTAGSRYGYLLVWVLVLANAVAVLVQYLSAKLGLVTGQTLPALLGARLPAPARIAFWAQAELVAMATDFAELTGGALALHLLFGVPLPAGGVLVAAASLVLLALQNRRSQRAFEQAVLGLLILIVLGFLAGLFFVPLRWADLAAGLIPRLRGPDTVVLAAGLLGATVMPHAIYLHSSLARDRHGPVTDPGALRRLLGATRIDVVLALLVAGTANIGMLVLAGTSLRGVTDTDSLEGAYAAIAGRLGAGVAAAFAVALLASGLASTAVGAYAGSAIMQGLLRRDLPVIATRLITIVPSLIIMASGVPPTTALVVSQVVLSLGIPFALVPLLRFTNSAALMGPWRNSPAVRVAAGGSAILIVALNLALVVLTLAPSA